MALQAVCVVDNRDAQEMLGYLEARVEAMKRRIKARNLRQLWSLPRDCANRCEIVRLVQRRQRH